jgi:hypothetical protein
LRPDVTDFETGWADLISTRYTFGYASPWFSSVYDPTRQDIYAKTGHYLFADLETSAQYTDPLYCSGIYAIVYFVSFYCYACKSTFKAGYL